MITSISPESLPLSSTPVPAFTLDGMLAAETNHWAKR
jgi:hypothetical protein